MYIYYLCDDGGVSNSENEILLPLKTIFRHEYGTYEVIRYLNDKGDGSTETKFSKITGVECERIKTNR